MLSSLTKRYTLFLVGCIGTRSVLAYTAYYLSQNPSERNTKILKVLAIIAILIGLGFLTIFITDSRKTGIETGGEKIWWNDWRPVFGMIWLLFGITALKGVKWCWIFLLLDVLLGLSIFVYHHFL
jgi:hypothetical protein